MKQRFLISIVLIALVVICRVLVRAPSLADRIGVDRQDVQLARAEFQDRFLAQADDHDTIMWLAEKGVAGKQWARAANLLAYIPTSHVRYGRSARHQQGQVLLRLNRSGEAETSLREFIDQERRSPASPDEYVVDAIQRLRSLLETQLRFEERRQLIQQMVRDGKGDVFDAVVYCFPNLLRWNGSAVISRLEAFYNLAPDDVRLRVALARYRGARGRLEEAREILQRCLQEQPLDLSVRAAWLELLKEDGDWESIQADIKTLPPASQEEPWHLLRIRGHAASRRGDIKTALHAFNLALQLDPANPECYNGLAVCYRSLHRPDEQKSAADRAQVLTRIQNRLGWTQTAPEDVQPFVEIVDLCLDIELHEQAYVMSRLAVRMAPRNADAAERMNLASKLYGEFE